MKSYVRRHRNILTTEWRLTLEDTATSSLQNWQALLTTGLVNCTLAPSLMLILSRMKSYYATQRRQYWLLIGMTSSGSITAFSISRITAMVTYFRCVAVLGVLYYAVWLCPAWLYSAVWLCPAWLYSAVWLCPAWLYYAVWLCPAWLYSAVWLCSAWLYSAVWLCTAWLYSLCGCARRGSIPLCGCVRRGSILLCGCARRGSIPLSPICAWISHY